MKKYLHYLKNLKTCLLFIGILCCCNNQSFSQNIRLKIERLGLRIFSPENGVEICGAYGIGFGDDCVSPGCHYNYPEPIVNNKLTINTIDYPLPELSGNDYITKITGPYYTSGGIEYHNVCLTGWTTSGWDFEEAADCSGLFGTPPLRDPIPAPTSLYALWYTNNNFNTSNDIDIEFNAFEDDNVACGGDDAGCFGWNPLNTLSDIPNTINPCGEELKDSMTCTSDGSTRNWGLHYKVSWQWRTLEQDEIDFGKSVCLGTDNIRIYSTSFGTLTNTNFQWQISTDLASWSNVTGSQVSVSVDLSPYTTPQFVYVRKVKTGIACSGFPTPADEYSNICIINIRAAPTVAPTATLVPNINGICEATIENPVDQYNGLVSILAWQYQTSYNNGSTWSASQATIPTLINPGTTNVTACIRFRAVYDCGTSPWRSYCWSLYPQIVAPVASTVYPLDLPFVTNYTCSTDSMYVVFTPGYGGPFGAEDEFEYTTDGGTIWLPYINGQRIRTSNGAGLSYGIRARRTSPSFPGSGCNTSTAYKYYGYWTPYRAATSPSLNTKTPNTTSICPSSVANVSATIDAGLYGIPGDAYDSYQYSIDSGISWNTYTSGANISTGAAVGAIIIRSKRLDGSSNNICSTNWRNMAKWLIFEPANVDFTYTSNLCHNPNAAIVEFTAINPSPGSGVWSITQGSGTLSSTTSLTIQLTGLSTSAPYTRVRWTVSEAGCNKNKSVTITPTTVSNINLTNGNTCQTCPVRNGTTFRFYDNTGKLMANIADNVSPVAELASTEVCVGIDASVQTVTTNYGDLQPYLQRHFSIDPSLNTSSNVTLYFTATEFNNLKIACLATPYAFTNVNELIVSKFPNGSNNTYTLPNTIGGTLILPSASGLDANGYYYITIPVSTFSTFYIHSFGNVPTVLPVELVYFEAKCETDKIKLEWQTATEKNNHHFEIERSANAIDFETILTAPTQNGNSNQLQDYLVYDNNPKNSTLYYRLKQVDNDGQFSYSKITTVDCNVSEKHNTVVAVYPNPTADVLTVAMNHFEEGKAWIKIFDISTNLILQNEINLTHGNNLYDIAVSNLSAGMYLIEISNNDRIVFRNKIVKQ